VDVPDVSDPAIFASSCRGAARCDAFRRNRVPRRTAGLTRASRERGRSLPLPPGEACFAAVPAMKMPLRGKLAAGHRTPDTAPRIARPQRGCSSLSARMCLRSAAQNPAEKSVLPRPSPSFSRRDSASTALCFAGAVTSASSGSVGSTSRAVALFAPQRNGLALPAALPRPLPPFLPTPAIDFPSLQPPSLSAHHRHVESGPPAPREVDWRDARWHTKQTLCSATTSSLPGSPARSATMCLVALDRPMRPALSPLRDRPVTASLHRSTSSSTLKFAEPVRVASPPPQT